MITKEDVEKFLEGFFIKVKVFGIRFRDDRSKNRDAIDDIPINPNNRENIIMQLQAIDYSDGPIIDTLNQGMEMWVFGKGYNDKEIYIKITLGYPDNRGVCISFHAAEHPMRYPFKD